MGCEALCDKNIVTCKPCEICEKCEQEPCDDCPVLDCPIQEPCDCPVCPKQDPCNCTVCEECPELPEPCDYATLNSELRDLENEK